MPALAVLLSLDYASDEMLQSRANRMETEEPENQLHLGDIVPFISGLLLGSDVNIRTWFSLFIRNGQKVLKINLLNPIKYTIYGLYFTATRKRHCSANITRRIA